MKPSSLICATPTRIITWRSTASDKTIYTYMGVLKPRMGSAGYSCAGQLSPLMKDPYYKTIGIGTRIFLGGGIGYVAWPGTQYNPGVPRSENGTPKGGRRHPVRDRRFETDESPLSGGHQHAGIWLHSDSRHRSTYSHIE